MVTVVVGNLPFLGLIVPNVVSMIRGDDLRSNLPWVCLVGIATVAAYITAVDVAGAAARAYALGVDYSAPRGAVEVTERAGLATAEATVPAPIGTMRATAVFPVEF